MRTCCKKYQTDVGKTWKVLNSITGHVRHNKSISDTFLVNGDKLLTNNSVHISPILVAVC